MQNWQSVVMLIATFGASAILAWGLLRINRRIFQKVQERYAGLYLSFFEKINGIVIIVACGILAFSALGGLNAVWKTILGGTAIISAVIAFAAQDVIRDSLAGMMIILHKPFEIGNRIELEDGTAGIVKDISMRHVVLHTWDQQQMIIPNSKLNAMTILNNSYQTTTRSVHMDFYIGYNSDVEAAMSVIRKAVMESPCSIPGKQTENGPDYAPVYFLSYESSSLHLATTVYYPETVETVDVKSDINCRVNLALKKNGIEIPYSYINVIRK